VRLKSCEIENRQRTLDLFTSQNGYLISFSVIVFVFRGNSNFLEHKPTEASQQQQQSKMKSNIFLLHNYHPYSEEGNNREEKKSIASSDFPK
jgi:hypothetical protein